VPPSFQASLGSWFSSGDALGLMQRPVPEKNIIVSIHKMKTIRTWRHHTGAKTGCKYLVHIEFLILCGDCGHCVHSGAFIRFAPSPHRSDGIAPLDVVRKQKSFHQEKGEGPKMMTVRSSYFSWLEIQGDFSWVSLEVRQWARPRACPRIVISSRRREILFAEVFPFSDFSLYHASFEMTKKEFSDKLLG
jgi:hypothetical protein